MHDDVTNVEIYVEYVGMTAGWKTKRADVCSEPDRSGAAHLVLLCEDLHQLCVNLLCFVRHLHVAVMHQDEVLVFVAGGGRHLRPQHRQSASRLHVWIQDPGPLLTHMGKFAMYVC